MSNVNNATVGVKYRPTLQEQETILGKGPSWAYKPAGFGGEFVRGRKLSFKGVYDFAFQGGAIANINLYDARTAPTSGPPIKSNGFSPLVLPYNFIVMLALIDVITAPTSGGSATIAFSTGASNNDLLTATAIASLTGLVATTPVGTAASAIKIGSAVTGSQGVIPFIKVQTATLTAGKINVHFEGFLGD